MRVVTVLVLFLAFVAYSTEEICSKKTNQNKCNNKADKGCVWDSEAGSCIYVSQDVACADMEEDACSTAEKCFWGFDLARRAEEDGVKEEMEGQEKDMEGGEEEDKDGERRLLQDALSEASCPNAGVAGTKNTCENMPFCKWKSSSKTCVFREDYDATATDDAPVDDLPEMDDEDKPEMDDEDKPEMDDEDKPEMDDEDKEMSATCFDNPCGELEKADCKQNDLCYYDSTNDACMVDPCTQKMDMDSCDGICTWMTMSMNKDVEEEGEGPEKDGEEKDGEDMEENEGKEKDGEGMDEDMEEGEEGKDKDGEKDGDEEMDGAETDKDDEDKETEDDCWWWGCGDDRRALAECNLDATKKSECETVAGCKWNNNQGECKIKADYDGTAKVDELTDIAADPDVPYDMDDADKPDVLEEKSMGMCIVDICTGKNKNKCNQASDCMYVKNPTVSARRLLQDEKVCMMDPCPMLGSEDCNESTFCNYNKYDKTCSYDACASKTENQCGKSDSCEWKSKDEEDKEDMDEEDTEESVCPEDATKKNECETVTNCRWKNNQNKCVFEEDYVPSRRFLQVEDDKCAATTKEECVADDDCQWKKKNSRCKLRQTEEVDEDTEEDEEESTGKCKAITEDMPEDKENEDMPEDKENEDMDKEDMDMEDMDMEKDEEDNKPEAGKNQDGEN